MKELFTDINNDNDLHPDYIGMYFGRNDTYKNYRLFLEEIWKVFAPFADINFSKEIKSIKKFQSRFFEMVLGYWLVKTGAHLEESKLKNDGGPDFVVKTGGKKVFIEAIATNRGTEGFPATVQKVPKEKRSWLVPEKNIILRITGAFCEKYKKFRKYIKNKIVEESDVKIIAINTYEIGHVLSAELREYAEMSFLGCSCNYQEKNGVLGRMKRDNIDKHTKDRIQEISVKIFAERDDNPKEISGVILSNDSLNNCSFDLDTIGEKFVLVLNPYANVPVPIEFINQFPQVVPSAL